MKIYREEVEARPCFCLSSVFISNYVPSSIARFSFILLHRQYIYVVQRQSAEQLKPNDFTLVRLLAISEIVLENRVIDNIGSGKTQGEEGETLDDPTAQDLQTMTTSLNVGGLIGVGYVCVTVAFFHILSAVCANYLPIPEAVLNHTDPSRVFRWKNLVISWCHAFITGLWSFYCVAIYFKDMWQDMVLYSNGPSYLLCCFTAGYFIYDMLDIILHKKCLQKWDILVHHSAIILSASYVVYYVECVAYQVLGMLAEVNTIFLHARQLAHLAETPSSNLAVKLNSASNFVTFLLFRFVPLGVLFWGVSFDGGRVPLWYVTYYTGCLIVLGLINCVLLYRLMIADCGGQSSRHRLDSQCSVKTKEDGHVKKIKIAAAMLEDNNNDTDSIVSDKMNGSARHKDDPLKHTVIKDVAQVNDGIQRKLNVRV